MINIPKIYNLLKSIKSDYVNKMHQFDKNESIFKLYNGDKRITDSDFQYDLF